MGDFGAPSSALKLPGVDAEPQKSWSGSGQFGGMLGPGHPKTLGTLVGMRTSRRPFFLEQFGKKSEETSLKVSWGILTNIVMIV